MGEAVVSMRWIAKSKFKSLEKMGEVIGISEKTLRRCFDGEDILFDSMLKVVRSLTPEEEVTRMKSYILNMKQNSRNLIPAIEYASTYRLYSCMKHIISLLREGTDREKEWAHMYQINHDMQNRSKPDAEFLEMVDDCRPETIEMQMFKKILQILLNFRLCKYTLALRYAEEAEKDFNKIEESFVKYSFKVRATEYKGLTYTYSYTDIELARKLTRKVIEMTTSPAFHATAYNNLGHTYMFDDYELALEYFEKSYELMKELDFNPSMPYANIVFLKNYWNKHRGLPDTNDLSEIAHYHAKQDNSDEALQILNSLDYHSPYKLYYRWLATGNIDHLLESAELFKGHHNYLFLKRLIEPELLKAGIMPKMAALICQ